MSDQDAEVIVNTENVPAIQRDLDMARDAYEDRDEEASRIAHQTKLPSDHQPHAAHGGELHK